MTFLHFVNSGEDRQRPLQEPFRHFHEMRQVTLKLNLTETRSETCEKALKKGNGGLCENWGVQIRGEATRVSWYEIRTRG